MSHPRLCLIVVPFWAMSAYASVSFVNLGTADNFAVLAGSTVTNTGPSVVNGDLGVSPGTSITGFAPGTLNGIEYAGGAVASQAQSDLTAAYNFAASTIDEPGCNVLTGQNLGGMTLDPGVYCFSTSASLTTGTGILTLDAEGDPNAVFVFQIGSTLTTGSGTSVDLIDGAQGSNVFWQVGSSATLGTTTAFAGNILAETSVTLDTGATIGCGGAFAINGAVTMDTNTVSACEVASGAPEPATGLLVLLIGMPGLLWRRRLKMFLGIRARKSSAALI